MRYRFREVSVKDGKEVEIPDMATHVGVYVDNEVSIVSWLETLEVKPLKVEPGGKIEGTVIRAKMMGGK
ncbi:hypothetical protein KAT51_08125 [bacterium]|nr:hypothetical protein [bacterium]